LTSDLVLAVNEVTVTRGVTIPRRQECVAVAHPEKIVVFNADRPIRCEAVLKASPDRPTPTCPFCLNDANAVDTIEKIPPLVGDRSAALHVPENVVPGITDLTREKTNPFVLEVQVSPGKNRLAFEFTARPNDSRQSHQRKGRSARDDFRLDDFTHDQNSTKNGECPCGCNSRGLGEVF
jgi:hypothetical protein